MNMEKEGLIRAIEVLQGQQNFDIECIVTDRHPQIRKWMRESMKSVKHYYDVWHVAKG